MGNHNRPSRSPIVVPTKDLTTLTFQVWTVMGRSQIAAYGTWHREEGPKSFNIGGALLTYDALHLPSLGQTVFAIGDEIRQSWRELSHPKAN